MMEVAILLVINLKKFQKQLPNIEQYHDKTCKTIEEKREVEKRQKNNNVS